MNPLHPNFLPHQMTPPPRKPLRIAILEADSLNPVARAKYGAYGGMFTAFLHAGADALGWKRDCLCIQGWDVVRVRGVHVGEYPALEDVDAVMITGSRYSAFENAAWMLRLVDYVKDILAQRRVRLLGVCFGHQIIGRAMGETVARSEKGWEVSVCQMELSRRGKELCDGKNSLNIFQMHRDIIRALPPGTTNLGTSPTCAVQGMYIPRRLMTVQGHPEFNKEIVAEILAVRREQGVFDAEAFDEAMARVGGNHDGVVVAKAFLRSLME